MDLGRIVQEGWLKLYQGSTLDGLIHFYYETGRSWGKLYADELARNMASTIPAEANVFSMQESGCPAVYHPIYISQLTGMTYEAVYTIYCDVEEHNDPAPLPGSLLLVGTGLGVIGLRRYHRS